MADRELAIIAKARTTLNDTSDAPRWTTERLMELLSEGQDAMCKDIPLYTCKATINTVPGQAEYRLPNDSVRLLRASSQGTALPILSYDEIEDSNMAWEEVTGSDVEALVVNALSQQTIRPYPLSNETRAIKTRYHARPILLGWDEATKDSDEELTISDMWDEGLKQYVIAMAFLDYGDEASNSRAQTALGLYNGYYQRALKLSKKSFAKRVVTTSYQAKVSSHQGGIYGNSSLRPRY